MTLELFKLVIYDPERKLAIGIGLLWSLARFMVAQLWAIHFAKNIAIYSVPARFLWPVYSLGQCLQHIKI